MNNNFFVITFSVTSDGTTGKEWIARLEANGFHISDSAKNILRSESFKPTSGTYEVVILKEEFFSDDRMTTIKIREEAKNRKLSTPNPEIACLIREKFSDDELNDIGIFCVITMHEPIKDSWGDYRLLDAYYGDDCSWLSANYSDNVWDCSDGFAFVSQVSNS